MLCVGCTHDLSCTHIYHIIPPNATDKCTDICTYLALALKLNLHMPCMGLRLNLYIPCMGLKLTRALVRLERTMNVLCH